MNYERGDLHKSLDEAMHRSLDEVRARQQPQVPKDTVIKDITEILRKIPLDDKQVNTLYEVIRGRVPSKSCVRCDRLKCIGFEGCKTEFMGEQHFVCFSCQEILREKSQS